MHELEKNNVIMKKKLKKIIHEQGISGVTYREGDSEGRNEDSRVKQKIDAEEDLQLVEGEPAPKKEPETKIKIVRVNSDSVDQMMDALSGDNMPVVEEEPL